MTWRKEEIEVGGEIAQGGNVALEFREAKDSLKYLKTVSGISRQFE